MVSLVAPSVLAADGAGFAATPSGLELARKTGRRATAVTKGLDGADDVVMHPARGNDSAASKTRRPMRARWPASSLPAFAASERGRAARRQCSTEPQAVCRKSLSGGHM